MLIIDCLSVNVWDHQNAVYYKKDANGGTLISVITNVSQISIALFTLTEVFVIMCQLDSD